jgi:hypothetical protein
MRRIIQLAGLASFGLLAACDGNGDGPEPVQARVALSAFNDCVELEQYIEDVATSQMRAQLDGYRDGNYWGGPIFAGAEDAAANSAGGTRGTQSAPTAYTKTNTQVAGVDEADFMKTDGTRIFVLSGQKLYAVRSWPAPDMALASSLTIQGWPQEMFLDERGRVVIFSSYYPQYSDTEAPYWCAWGCGYSGYTKITVVSATDEDNLQVTEQLYLPGNYASARRIGDSVRVVLRDYLNLPEGVRYWPDYTGDWERDEARFVAALDEIKASNEALIRAQTLNDWLPQAYRAGVAGDVAIARSCTDFSRPNAPVRLGLASIATLNMVGQQSSLHMSTILGEVGEVYASQSNLYVASPHWWWWPADNQRNYTYIHKFDITRGDRAVYVASGGVEGYVLNQFAMDEHNGFLRVATTIDRWFRSNEWFDVETTNRVSVLGEVSGFLATVGRTPELADDERIQSARFMGDTGYLVTFEQIDPLFTMDLSNPARPTIVGELEVPGFSSYIHPLDEDHLLTIGVHLPEPGPNGQVDWSQRAMKLSIFDVSDLAHPRQAFVQTVGTANGWSEAAWEHKAFNYFPERQMLAIPFSDWLPSANGHYWDNFISDLRLFHIDAQQGITPRGSIDMAEVYQRVDYYDWSWYYSPWIRRSVMADDFAYAVSDAGIRVANMNSPSTPVATVLFEGVHAGR